MPDRPMPPDSRQPRRSLVTRAAPLGPRRSERTPGEASLVEPGPGASGDEGVLLLGTAETLLTAVAQAAASPMIRPRLIGAVLVPTGADVGPAHRRAVDQNATEGEAALDAHEPWIGGLPVLGTLDRLPALVDRGGVSLVLVSVPAAMSKVLDAAVGALELLGVDYRVLPTIEDVALSEQCAPAALAHPTNSASGLPGRINLEALVGRPARTPNHSLIREVVTGKRVLITGAGGSIGSELARLCARFDPELLILMDRAENVLFDIDRHMAEHHPHMPRQTLLNDVVNRDATRSRLLAWRPDAVFHAAAHKHVPLMQDHPAEALNNNLFGTRSVADAALEAGVERFVFVSTDKAVRPSSVMGATKQLAERYIRSLNAQEKTRFCLVRFGNVLGSAASVLPIWASQIAGGGPITVTDPAMTRYFMTIPEAASLVLQAAAIATTSEANPDLDPADVFVLDMGEPVHIIDLAKRFARSLGLTALTDDEAALVSPAGAPKGPAVRIRVTGARPGEKLHEQLAHDHAQLEETVVPGVFCWRGSLPCEGEVERMIATLSHLRFIDDAEVVTSAIRAHVPDMRPPDAGPTRPINRTKHDQEFADSERAA